MLVRTYRRTLLADAGKANKRGGTKRYTEKESVVNARVRPCSISAMSFVACCVWLATY
jgi:hypothetical protein